MGSYPIRADWFNWPGGLPHPGGGGAFQQPTVTGATLVIPFDDDLTANSPTASQFTCLVAAVGRTVNAAVAAGRNVTLTLATPVTTGQAVTVAYSAAGAVKVLDSRAKVAPAFAAINVTNLT